MLPTKSSILLLLLLLLSILGSIPAAADIVEANTDIADNGTEKLIAMLPEAHLGLPATLGTPHDVYLFIRTGASVLDVRLLAQTSVDPRRLARLLASAGTHLRQGPETVEWTREDDYCAARFVLSYGHLGSRQRTQWVPYGQLVEAVRQEGFTPHVLLRIPRYTDQTPSSYRDKSLVNPGDTTRNYRWYNISSADKNAGVMVHAAYTDQEYLGAALFPFFVPLVGGLGLIAAIVLARSRAIPIEKRRQIYPKLAIWPTFGAIALHIPFTIFYFSSPNMLKTNDLWFGCTSGGSAIVQMIMAGPLAVILLLPLAMCVEQRLFGPDENRPPVPVMPPEEKKIRRNLVLLCFIPFALCMTMIFTRDTILPHHSPLRPFWFVAAMAINFFGSMLIARLANNRLKRFAPESSDDTLTRRAEYLAEFLGGHVQSVRIQESAGAKMVATAQVTPKGNISVSRKMLEELTEPEIDFVLAHEIAHVQGKHAKKQIYLLMLSPLFIIAPMGLILSGQVHFASSASPLLLSAFAMLLPIAGTGILFFGMSRFSKSHELAADREALRVTSNLSAAESALRKMARFSQLPYAHEVDMLSTHPKMSHRFAALRQAARDLGITED